jgi:tetratricopeptide (TPR) repeat protein
VKHEEFVRRASKRILVAQPAQRGLPPRVYIPIVAVLAAVFLGAMAWLVHAGFTTGGSVFGTGTGASSHAGGAPPPGPPAVSVEGGGPPPGVRMQLQELRNRVARNPKDDVALTQLGDMYLAVGKYAQAIPYYRRALATNPNNVAAKEGMSEAQSGLKNQ